MKTIVTPEPSPALVDLFRRLSGAGSSRQMHTVLTSTGRSAYMLGLRALGLGENARILLPALCCRALSAATRVVGAIPVYYEIKDDLSPDFDRLEKQARGARAIVVIHYFGFPQPMEEILDFCKRTQILSIEDCAHALYSRLDDRPLGSFGTFSFFSIRKFLPVPCGGVLAWNDSRHLPDFPLPRSLRFELASTAKHVFRYAENRFLSTPRASLLKWEGLRRAVARADASTDFAPMASTRLSQKVLLHSDERAIVAQRRRNFAFLLDATGNLPGDHSIHRPLGKGVNPMGFPLLAPNRSSFIRHMLRHKIVARPLWSELPESVDESNYPTASRIGRHLAYLPVHQGLRGSQLERVGLALREYLGDAADGKISDS